MPSNLKDWTVGLDGRTNSSVEYLRIVEHVNMLIRSEAVALIHGNSITVARLIVSQLAHVYNMRPIDNVSISHKPDTD